MESIGFALAKIFSERCTVHVAQPSRDLDTVCRQLVEKGGLSREEAEALLWGEDLHLSLVTTENLAEAFDLDPDLLGCLLRPTSREIVLHVLRSFRSQIDPSCEDCNFLGVALEEAPRMSKSELLQTAVDFLEHFSPAEEESALSPKAESLLDVFSELSTDSQARVLAYAYSEAANSLDDPLQRQIALYSDLREVLPQIHRQALDLLALEEDELSVRQIAVQLGLPHARSIGQLPRSIDKLLESAASPLLVRRSGGQSFYRMSDSVLPLWQSLLRADATLQG